MSQGGNVWEWEETDLDLVNDSSSSSRAARGGGWFSGPIFLSSSLGGSAIDPTDRDNKLGFRVASTPEPSTLLLAVSIFALLAGRRSRR
jgi:formylglycine-generating enzyme required for sulfatase activity